MAVTGGRSHEESCRLGGPAQGVPRSSHADWAPANDRPDPIDLIEAQNATRLEWQS